MDRRERELIGAKRTAAPSGTPVIRLGMLISRNGSVAPIRLIELLTYRLRQMSIRATKPRATALENCRVRLAVDLWRLYLENGHWRADFLIDRMTGSGRLVSPAGAL